MTIILALTDRRMRDELSSTHVSNDHLAAFLDGRLTGSERERAVRHFTGCVECREELTALREMLAGTRPDSRRWVTAAAVAAAAIVAIVTVPRMMGDVADVGTGRVRAEQGAQLPEGRGLIMVVSPADQATVPLGSVELTWRASGVAATYTVTVQDSSGSEVWKRVSLADTNVTVPDSVRLRPGSFYFWSVDARLADGNSVKTEPRTFIVR